MLTDVVFHNIAARFLEFPEIAFIGNTLLSEVIDWACLHENLSDDTSSIALPIIYGSDTLDTSLT